MRTLGIALAAAGALMIIASAVALATDDVVADRVAANRVDVYPLDTCAVARSKLGGMGEPVVIRHEGREFRFCCGKCTPKFEADPAKFIASVDERIIAQQRATYPLSACPVSGEKLDEKAHEFVVNNQLVRTCCEDCAAKVIAAPQATLAKIDAAIVEAQGKCYPLTTCVVSGEELGSMGTPVDALVGHRLVRLCCKSCLTQLAKDPAAALARVEAAWSPSGKGAEKGPAKPGEPGMEKKEEKPEEGAKPKTPSPGNEKKPEGGSGG